MTGSGKKNSMLPPHLTTLLWASQSLNFQHQWDGPHRSKLWSIGQGDWGRASGALFGLPENDLNFNPLGPLWVL